MHRIRFGGLLAALALSAACSSVDAAPPEPAAPADPAPSAAAIEIAGRLEASSADRVPGLHELTVEQAAAAASRAGAKLRVVVMGEGLTISAQYPSPGERLPDDGMVTVWRGTPPALPVAAPEVAAASGGPSAAEGVGGRVGEPPEDGDGPPPLSEPTAPPPHPPRVNPIRLPEAEAGVVMTGLASWYGAEFAGRTTACGGVFDPGELTLASRELRCGTTVRITGPSGASVEAVATDWGPAEWTGRRFDLSAATFAAIHHPGAGVVTVTVEVLGP